ncbi:hypothetical protein [Amycolatopsis alba]|uniref:hypothetical protein n=1 Tax=Amycolatopsis alba TaxID=76020 RepID=UPI00037333A0|nr:hypothetical protein [Amycolatopsis alba]
MARREIAIATSMMKCASPDPTPRPSIARASAAAMSASLIRSRSASTGLAAITRARRIGAGKMPARSGDGVFGAPELVQRPIEILVP